MKPYTYILVYLWTVSGGHKVIVHLGTRRGMRWEENFKKEHMKPFTLSESVPCTVKWRCWSVPRLGRLRGSPRFSDLCLLFVLGSLCLSFGPCFPSAAQACGFSVHDITSVLGSPFPWLLCGFRPHLQPAWFPQPSLRPVLVWPVQTTPTLGVQVGRPLVHLCPQQVLMASL